MLPGVAPMVDNLFLLAVAALGWGLSLATYRLFARSEAGRWVRCRPICPSSRF